MAPEQTALAARDVRTKQLMPVHWGKFVLANHSWNEPIKRLMVAARDAEFDVVTPTIGDVISVGAPVVRNAWWEQVSK